MSDKKNEARRKGEIISQIMLWERKRAAKMNPIGDDDG